MKRDDFYTPFGAGEVNGGKLRQCMMLTDSVLASSRGVRCLFTYCGIHSPQAPITAASARFYGLKCQILYGGTKEKTLLTLPMPRLAMRYGAKIIIAAGSGRHNVLHAKAKELAGDNGFIVRYGINLTGHGDVLLGAVSEQTRNLPDSMENLVITCGSGITAAGVMIGLRRNEKTVKNVHLVATAPDRRGFIHDTLRQYEADREFHYHSLFHQRGFIYERGVNATFGGIKLHPHYEAKTMQWFLRSGLNPKETLFWITGAQPRDK
jgi:1-aminocyclopropane-1-carboxylate deaminase/D-cysteine desulfhydrase-like pyridoxal-dependent ACC family enzyme